METKISSDQKNNKNLIKSVRPGSPADMAGIEPGSYLVSINGHKIGDIFDYYHFTDGVDLGLEFDDALLDSYRSCRNKCIFCFIDQMPKNMRETLYFKDDDTRLSFLQGNYVTLTNVNDTELNRIIEYRLAPINISIHATDPDVRVKMLNNRFAGDVLEKMERIRAAGLPMNGQIVLCKGINDGKVLEDSLRTLKDFYPSLQSLSVVPVGITKFREGLFPLESFTREDALSVIKEVGTFQREFLRSLGTRLVYLSDEFYIMAGAPLPKDREYEGYPQLENGVGMTRLFINEFLLELKKQAPPALPFLAKKREISLATGKLFGGYMKRLAKRLTEKHKNIKVHVYPIENRFFGEKITVTGLITGRDVISQLKGKPLGSCLYIPRNMLKYGEEVFLDDVTIRDVEKALKVPVYVSSGGGEDLVRRIIHGN